MISKETNESSQNLGTRERFDKQMIFKLRSQGSSEGQWKEREDWGKCSKTGLMLESNDTG